VIQLSEHDEKTGRPHPNTIQTAFKLMQVRSYSQEVKSFVPWGFVRPAGGINIFRPYIESNSKYKRWFV
jgi:hypothetical protein